MNVNHSFQVKMYEDDPLVYHHKLKAKWGSEFLRAVDVSQQGIKAISIPSLIFHGTEDQIVGITASELINSETASTDKTYEVSYTLHNIARPFLIST